MNDAADRVIEALEGHGCRPKRRGAGWVALCPAHADKTPSLSVSVGSDQPAVIYCHAGCSAAAVLDQIGLSTDDICRTVERTRPRAARKTSRTRKSNGTSRKSEWVPVVGQWCDALWRDPDLAGFLQEKRGLEKNVILASEIGHDGERFTVPVFDQNGDVIYIKRYLPDGDPKMLMPKGAQAALYGVETLGYLEDDSLVLVVEGELEALFWRSHGYSAVSGTAGAGCWRDEWSEDLARFQIVCVGDHDAAGAAYAKKAAESLKKVGVTAQIVAWPPGTPSGTDATDFVVQQGHTADELRTLVDTALEAGGLRALDLRGLLTEPVEPIPWIVQGWLAHRDVVCLAGEPKLGKSLIALELALALAASRPFLHRLEVHGEPRRVLYVDEENNPRLIRYRVRKLAVGLGLDADRLAGLDLRYLSENALNLDDSARLQALFREVRRYRPDLVVFDSLVRFHRRDENSNAAMSAFFTGVVKPLAAQFDCAVLMLHHLAKPSKDRPGGAGHRVRGASDIAAQVDQLWILERRKNGDLRLGHEMSRWAETAPALSVNIEDVFGGNGLRIVAQEAQNAAREAILELLEDRGADGALRQDLISAVQDSGVQSDQRMTSKALATLHKDGSVRKRKEGKEMRYWAAEHAPEDVE